MEFRQATIIGTGALGSTLARALHVNEFRITGLYNRTPSKAESLAKVLKIEHCGPFPGPDEDKALAELIFLTVPDDEIRPAAEKIAESYASLSGKTFVHCSGNYTSDLLQPLSLKQASTASFHPLQTFNEQSSPSNFDNIFITLEGDEKTLKPLGELVKMLNARPLVIESGDKSHLHAAAVVASNYLVSLLDAAEEIGSRGSLKREQVRRALYPLINTTLSNAKSGELSSIITGPVARGDISTVENHLQLLSGTPLLLELYKNLGLRALSLSKEKESLTPEQAKKLENLFS